MTHCVNCRHWNMDPNDNGMGECTGLLESPMIEINCGVMGLDAEEIFTNATFGCELGVDKTIPHELS